MKSNKTIELEWGDLMEQKAGERLPEEAAEALEIRIKGHRNAFGRDELPDDSEAVGKLFLAYKQAREIGYQDVRFYSESSLDIALPKKVDLGLRGLFEFECNPVQAAKRPQRNRYQIRTAEKMARPELKPPTKDGETLNMTWAHLESENHQIYFPEAGEKVHIRVSGERALDDPALSLGKVLALYAHLKRQGAEVSIEFAEADRDIVEKMQVGNLDQIQGFEYRVA